MGNGELFTMTTTSGYDFFEVSSAFQKSVRRGLEEDALYWGMELVKSNYDEYLWKRIKIISSEDIGLAEPNISANIAALNGFYNEQKAKKDKKHTPEHLFIIHAIILLCRARKSRLVDWKAICHTCGERKKKEIPDYALDKHTRKGKSKKRGFEHFFQESTILENHFVQEGEELARTEAYSILIGNKNG